MRYLDLLKELEHEKNIAGGAALSKLTKPSFGGSVSEVPPPENISPSPDEGSSPIRDMTERRRAEALEILERQPSITRAFVTDAMADGTVTIMLAIRGVGSGELTIPAGRSDPAALIQLFDELERKL